MSGGKPATISNVTPAVGAVNIQQSSYGLAIPIVWGRTRITGNLIWYGDFVATPHTEVTQSGGKGGAGGIKQSTTTYTYAAAVMMAIAEGPILGIRSAWRGKQVYGGAAVTTKTIKTTETFSPSTTTVTVANAAGFQSNVSVEILNPDLDYKRGWTPLVINKDYTVASGVYTFTSIPANDIRITYVYNQTASNVSALGELGLSLANGYQAQAPWGYLTSKHPTQAVGYSGIAYVYGSNYALTGNAEVDNHSFEVDAALQFSSTIPDANPADVTQDFLSNPIYGANFNLASIGSLTDFKNSSTAQGIFVSPALTEQAPAVDFLQQIAAITNVGMVWSENVLKFVPYCDMPITGNGVTYTPNTSPIYDLTDDDFLPNGESGPIKITRTAQADAFNRVQVEFRNRANAYNLEIMEAKDQADIENYGIRSMPTVQAHMICDKNTARVVAQLLLQRSLYIRNQYEFKLGWNKIALEPMDLVTLTDSGLGLNLQPVRIKTIEENEDGELTITAEEFPKGSASATLYPSGSGSGFAHNYNVPPGNAYTPVIFEGVAAMAAASTDGLEIWLATGGGDNYGGCEIWTSLDGTTYERAYTMQGKSRYGTTTSSMSSRTTAGSYNESVGVSLLAGGQLLAGTTTDLNQLSTLCYVGGEFFAYQAATLTGTNAYTIGPHLNRGAYLSGQAAHSSGSVFVRCDEAIAKMPLTKDYIGKTIYIKLLAFNYYKGALQSLADVSPYSYTITGSQANLPPIAPPNLALEGTFTIDTAKFKWDRVGNAASYNVQIYDTSTMTKRREVNVGDALRYDYSAADAKSDGGPWRGITIKVQGINANGAAGAFASLAVTNAQLGALSNVKITSGLKSFFFTCDRPTDPDFAGVQIHISTTNGFTPDSTTLVYDGGNTSFTLTALQDGTLLDGTTTYYIKWAGYDTFDKLGMTFGASAGVVANTVVINQTATAYLYQWSSTVPSGPTGTSTFTWATAANSGYSLSDGWSVSVPSNPGTPGVQLWVATKSVTGSGTSTTIAWTGASISAWSQNGDNGADGPKSAKAIVYQWAATIPTISGTSTYTWATDVSSPLPSGWFTISGTSPSQGYTLWAATVNVTDSGSATTTTINWATASIIAAGYAGGNGLSSRVMYARIASNPTPVSGTVTTTGNSSFPTGTASSAVWGASFNVTWGATDPSPSSNDSLYVSDGIYDPSTNQTSWGTPYISSLKVGNLSAVSVNTGSLDITGNLTVATTGAFRGGKTSYSDTAAGFWQGYTGGAYKMSFGSSTTNFSWDGSKFLMNVYGGSVAFGSASGESITSFTRSSSTGTSPAVGIYDTPGSPSGLPSLFVNSNSTSSSGAVNISASGTLSLSVDSSNSSNAAGKFSNSALGKEISLGGTYCAYSGSGKGKIYILDGNGPFTGFHDGLILKSAMFEIGDIVVIKRIVYKHDVSNTLAEVELSSEPNQKTRFGIISELMPFDNHLELPYELWWELSETHNLVSVNGVGEGQVNVCGENGNIEAGDLITTSSMVGKGMRAEDSISVNRIVCQATESVNFDSPDQVKMIACVYMCG